MKAITIKEITGCRIPTIPIGTEFEIISILEEYNYATCSGLPVSSVWTSEYILITEKKGNQ